MKKERTTGRRTTSRDVARRAGREGRKETRGGANEPERINDDALGTVTGGRDPASGLPTGQRMHKPYTLT